MNSNLQIIQKLQQTASSVLDALIPDGARVAVLDYPNYANVGDSLIWLGEMAYLRSRGISPVYVCAPENYCKTSLEKALGLEDSIILLQGGGNFGTLWPDLQAFRERVLTDFPGVRVIQFPQSLYFDDQEKLKKTAEVIGAHGNFTLLTRDKPSYELARENFDCDVLMCPDMAFFIGSVTLNKTAPYDRFVLSRTDKEKKGNWQERLPAMAGGATLNVDDWLESGRAERLLQRIERHTVALRRWLDRDNRMLLRLWNTLAKARMARGVALLQRGRIVITDRLHAHILSTLLNKPHALIDNSYGKLGNFYHAWTESYPLAQLVTDVEAAIRAADILDATTARAGK